MLMNCAMTSGLISRFTMRQFSVNISGYILLTAIIILVSHGAFAQRAVPALWGLRVHDEARVLSAAVVQRLETQLKQHEDSTGNQIAVLIIQSLEGETLEDYSLRVAHDAWKLGSKNNDNGVLLLVAVEDRQMRIEVGQGLEGVLTDAATNRIIRNEMVPNFRRGDYNTGVQAATDAIIQVIAGEYKNTGSASKPRSVNPLVIILLIIVILGLIGRFTKGGNKGNNRGGSWLPGRGWYGGVLGRRSGSFGGGGFGGFSGGGGSFGGGGSSGRW